MSLGLGCSSAQPGRPRVESVRFLGQGDLDGVDLQEGLANHAPRGIWPFDEVAYLDSLALRLDQSRLVSHLKSEGYYNAAVLEPSVRPTENGGAAIDYRLFLGKPSRLVNVVFRGLSETDLSEAEAKQALGDRLNLGEPFRYAEYDEAKSILSQRLRAEGYAHVSVKGRARVHAELGQVWLEFQIEPGPLAVFGETEIISPVIPEASIRARILWKPGDRFDPKLLEQTEAQLYELGLVGSVSLELPEDPKSERLDIRLSVKAGEKNELRLGGGLARSENEIQARLRAGYTRKDFFHPLMAIALEARPSTAIDNLDFHTRPQLEAFAELSREDLAWVRLIGKARVTYARLHYEAFVNQNFEGRLTLSRPFLGQSLSLSLGLGVARLGFPEVNAALSAEDRRRAGLISCASQSGTQGSSQAACPNDAPGFSLYYLRPAITYDRRDNPNEPTQGFFAQLDLEWGRTAGGRQDHYLKWNPELRGYLSLGPRVVLASRIAYGHAMVLQGQLPATRRYFAGGSESQRGFAARRISPFAGSVTHPVPIGGRAEIKASVEARLLLFKVFDSWLGLVGFVDAADVSEGLGEINLMKLHLAAGPGLRFHTPVGPIRLDVGFRLNRRAPGETASTSSWAFHLSLGEAF